MVDVEVLTVVTGSSITVTIRFDRSSGSSQLVRTVDEVDLPWLRQLLDELCAEPEALVTLVDEPQEDRLIIRIRAGTFVVERSRIGVESSLVRDVPTDRAGGRSADGSDGAPTDPARLDLDAVRIALDSVLRDRPLPPGLRWV